MANVGEYPVGGTEKLRPDYQGQFTTQASPEDFGAGVGRGLQSVAQGLQNAGQAMAAVNSLVEQTRAKDALNAYQADLRDLNYNPDSGFMFKQGKDAVDGYKSYSDKIEELRKKNGAGLSGESARIYGETSQSHANQSMQTGMIHSGSERKTWINDTAKARMDSFQQDALAAYANPKEVEKNLAAGLNEMHQYAEANGWSKDQLMEEGKKYVSKTHTAVIGRMADADPIAANEYYQKNRDKMTGSDQAAVDQALREGVAAEKGKNAGANILGTKSGDIVMNTIKHFEGFSAKPYWDVNASRAGYGSDTVTRPDGTVVKVSPGMTVDRGDAERDLQRRIGEYQQGIIGKIGGEAWRTLSAGAQAALTSIAYNYGSLPDRIVGAARSGDPQVLANAIRGLGSDNNGVNQYRRAQEAGLVEGKTLAASQSFVDIETQLQAITDPREQQAARNYVNGMLNAQEADQKARAQEAQKQLFSVVEQGGTPDQLPLETRIQAGEASMSAAWGYHEARVKQGEPTSDQVMLYKMRLTAAADPKTFAEINLLQYRDKLSNADFKELTDKQADYAKGLSPANLENGKAISERMGWASKALASAGLTLTGLGGEKNIDARNAMETRIAKFQNTLYGQVEAFAKDNGRLPDYSESQALINKLLMPMLVKTPGTLWGENSDSRLNFETGTVADNAVVAPNIPIENVPAPVANAIKNTLESATGQPATPEDVADVYARMQAGLPPPVSLRYVQHPPGSAQARPRDPRLIYTAPAGPADDPFRGMGITETPEFKNPWDAP